MKKILILYFLIIFFTSCDRDKEYFNNRYLNVLQLGEFGYHLTDIKQRFIDTGIIMRKKKLIKIEIQVSQEEINIINLACTLYWKILCGHLDYLSNIDLHINLYLSSILIFQLHYNLFSIQITS